MAWDSPLAGATRFTLQLTEHGRHARNSPGNPFPGYTSDSQSISRDPVELDRLSNGLGGFFLRRFWATYSIDTTLGRWVSMAPSSRQ